MRALGPPPLAGELPQQHRAAALQLSARSDDEQRRALLVGPQAVSALARVHVRQRHLLRLRVHGGQPEGRDVRRGAVSRQEARRRAGRRRRRARLQAQARHQDTHERLGGAERHELGQLRARSARLDCGRVARHRRSGHLHGRAHRRRAHRVREGQRRQHAHGLHRGVLEPARRELRHRARRSPQEQAHRRPHHTSDCNDHVAHCRPRLHRGVQAGAGPSQHRDVQEQLCESGAAVLRPQRAHAAQEGQVLRDDVLAVGPLRGQRRDDAARVSRSLQERARARDHHVVAGRHHAIRLLHGQEEARRTTRHDVS